jgi:hypothetical protein
LRPAARGIGRDTARGAHARALHEAVIDDAEKLSRIGREQQPGRCSGPPVPDNASFTRRDVPLIVAAGHDVRIEPDGRDAGLRPCARHRLQIVDGAFPRDWYDRVLPRNIDGIVIAEIGERRLDCRDAIWHLSRGSTSSLVSRIIAWSGLKAPGP